MFLHCLIKTKPRFKESRASIHYCMSIIPVLSGDMNEFMKRGFRILKRYACSVFRSGVNRNRLLIQEPTISVVLPLCTLGHMSIVHIRVEMELILVHQTSFVRAVKWLKASYPYVCL